LPVVGNAGNQLLRAERLNPQAVAGAALHYLVLARLFQEILARNFALLVNFLEGSFANILT